ncbi:hypothetical protein [Streptomyces sp. BE20]|uniref:hypothetical protein n=1 Tax=Streptomycetaceae TaxID=2062 RepID=UPI002E782C87|nr:hypothetical protein [Streptomyces sp. BE20]MEE1825611.1 hypothetical protein [Streptomyces sp. BE20]
MITETGPEVVNCLVCAAWAALEQVSEEAEDHSRAVDARIHAARHREAEHGG